MSADTITAKRAIELLEMAVAERGEDYVYQKVARPGGVGQACVYVHNGQPSCMVGLALFLYGASIETLDALRGGARGIPSKLPFVSAKAADVLKLAQEAQDNGLSWGEALDAARRRR